MKTSSDARMREHRLRLPPDFVDRFEALRPYIGDEPELATRARVTRADVERLAILRGLQELEARYLAPEATGRLPGVDG